MRNEKKLISFVRFAVLLVPSVLILAYFQKMFWNYTSDDAYISFRYARNFAKGLGLVFNSGEKVEGFSNFLWTIMLGIGAFFTHDLVTLSKIFGILSGLGMIIFSSLTGYLAAKKNWLIVLPISTLIAVNASMEFYAGSGLETIFFGFLLAAGTYFYLLDTNKFLKSLSFLFFCCASLTRPEGILYLGFILLYRVVDRIAFKSKFSAYEYVSMSIAVLGFASFIMFRYLYYDDILPNTYYAKTLDWILSYKFPTDGIRFTLQFLLDNGGIFILPLCVLLLKNRKGLRSFLLIIGILSCGFAFMVYATFDWMSMHRFLIPVIGLLTAGALAGAFSHRNAMGMLHSSIVYVVFTAVLLLVFGTNQIQVADNFRKNELNYPNMVMNSVTLRDVGMDLKKKYNGFGTLVTKRLGAVPYYSELVTFDIFGLTDKEIAFLYHTYERGKRNQLLGQKLLERKPDYLLLYAGIIPKDPNMPTSNEILSFSYPDSYVLAEAMKYHYRFVKRYATGKGEWAYLYKK